MVRSDPILNQNLQAQKTRRLGAETRGADRRPQGVAERPLCTGFDETGGHN